MGSTKAEAQATDEAVNLGQELDLGKIDSCATTTPSTTQQDTINLKNRPNWSEEKASFTEVRS